ncbi:MAG: tetratricopeptide repeat protein [Gemmataceae bacterium]|nr:tetratricopeptide repeat protein [Gemmataceae bacterium]
MEYEFLGLVQLGFTVWMLVDAYRRQADTIWYFIIFMFPFVGAWAYFIAVKLNDFSGMRLWPFVPGRPSLEELRYRVEQTPTLASRLELAERLMERGQHAEAIPLLEAAHQQEPEHCQIVFDLAVCHSEQGHPERSLPLLDRIIQRDRSWSDYQAWRLLAATRAQAGDSQGALAACRELARLAPTMQNSCLLVERLIAEGKTDEAATVLEDSLESYRFAPRSSRRRNRRWARHARRLQKRIHATSRA